MQLYYLASFAFCFAPQAPAYANESFTSQCIEEYSLGHLEKALYYCHGAASHAQAQYILGRIYSMEGMASTQMKKAYEYFAAAANQNHPDAQFMLALCYQNGLGVPKNSDTATYWYNQALSHGFSAPALNPELDRKNEKIATENWPGADEMVQASQVKTADPSNIDTRIALLNNAALKGNSEAEYELGMIYALGDGVPQDDGKALWWLQKAAAKNHSGAQSYLAWMSMLGFGLKQSQAQAVQLFLLAKQTSAHSSETLENDLNQVFDDLQNEHTHLVNRSPRGEFFQGKELIEARLNNRDLKDGLELVNKAAKEGYPAAQLYLAKLYHEGNLVKKDIAKATKWYHLAAENKETEAQYTLGWMYFYGEGVPQSNSEAFHWFSLANANEAKAKAAMEFVENLEAKRPLIELGPQRTSTPFKVKLQRAGTYLRSLLPSRSSS